MNSVRDILKPVRDTFEATIRHKEKWLREGVTFVPNVLIFDKKISPQAKALLLVIAGHAFVEGNLFGEGRDCRVSHALISEELGVSPPWISKYGKELVDIGVIEIQRTGRSSFYYVSFSALEKRAEEVVKHLRGVRMNLKKQTREI